MVDGQKAEDSEDELHVPRSPNLMVTSPTFMTQETQTSLKSEPYHPPAEKLKVRKTRHRRASYGSNAPHSPRLSPMRERRVSSSSARGNFWPFWQSLTIFVLFWHFLVYFLAISVFLGFLATFRKHFLVFFCLSIHKANQAMNIPDHLLLDN